MAWILIGISLYLTYYTFMQARSIWKKESKFAGVIVGMLASLFPMLTVWILYH